MQIQDASISGLMEHIGEHYRNNITNRFIRPTLLQLSIDHQTWDLVEALSKKTGGYDFQLDETYREIIAAAHFVAIIRRELIPGIRNKVQKSNVSGADKVLQDMAVNNFTSNLQVFSDLLNELYIKLVEADKNMSKGRLPVYTQIPELAGVGQLFAGA